MYILRENDSNPDNLNGHFGALAMIIINAMFGVAQPVLLQFPFERPLFLREYSTGNCFCIFDYWKRKHVSHRSCLPRYLFCGTLFFVKDCNRAPSFIFAVACRHVDCVLHDWLARQLYFTHDCHVDAWMCIRIRRDVAWICI